MLSFERPLVWPVSTNTLTWGRFCWTPWHYSAGRTFPLGGVEDICSRPFSYLATDNRYKTVVHHPSSGQIRLGRHRESSMVWWIHAWAYIQSASLLSQARFFCVRNRSPPLEGAILGSFLPVKCIMIKEIKREDIEHLNTMQLIAMCWKYSVGYVEKVAQSKKTNAAKRDAL